MEVDYRRNPQGNYMVLSHPETQGQNSYSLQMILKNHIPGLLATEQEIMNGQIRLLYDITSKRSLADVMETEKIGQARFRTLITDLTNCVEGFREYLLDLNEILFEPESIFLDQETGRFFFCYDPFHEGNYQAAVRVLMDRILEKIEYEDPDYVRLVYELHSLVQKEHFRFRELSALLSETEGSDIFSVRSLFEEEPGEEGPADRKDPGTLSAQKNESGNKELPEETTGLYEKIKAYMKGKKIRDVVSDIDNGVFLQKVNRPGGTPPASIDRKKKPGSREDLLEMPPVRIREEHSEQPSSELLDRLIQEDAERLFRESIVSETHWNSQTVLLGKKECSGPCLVGIGKMQGSVIEIRQFPFHIGKLKGETECVLDSSVISRMHAKISEKDQGSDGEYLIEDLNSTNGTFVNGVRLAPYNKVTIRPGDVIRFANREYVFQSGSSRGQISGAVRLK